VTRHTSQPRGRSLALRPISAWSCRGLPGFAGSNLPNATYGISTGVEAALRCPMTHTMLCVLPPSSSRTTPLRPRFEFCRICRWKWLEWAQGIDPHMQPAKVPTKRLSDANGKIIAMSGFVRLRSSTTSALAPAVVRRSDPVRTSLNRRIGYGMSPKAFTEPLVGEARAAFRKTMADHLKPFVAGAA
jgi:hypothetical protein